MATEPKADSEATESTFMGAVLGKAFFDLPAVQWLMGLPIPWRVSGIVAALASLLLVPYLGAVGLWDPWETHYGEVAREMIQRRDYVHPYWENAWFFSKPVFTMWMQAFGMQLVGTMRTDGALGRFTEWGFRLPFVAFSILAVTLMAQALARVVSRRVGYAVAFVLCTMPLYFLISRQAVTDTPMIAAQVCAMACVIVAQFDEKSHRTGWWYAFYVFMAIGTLAKGLLGMLPGAILLLYAVLSVIPWNLKELEEHCSWFWRLAMVPFMGAVGALLPVALVKYAFKLEVHEIALPASALCVAVFLVLMRGHPKVGSNVPVLWAQIFRMKLGTGFLLFLAVAAPWYQRMMMFEQVDDESKLFWYRFLIHDHAQRLAAGVHTTTPGGSFTYFIEQGGFAIFPWVVLVPGAAAVIARLKLRGGTKADHVGVLASVWLVTLFMLMGASATKFHHYVLPMLPPLAVLMAMFVDRLWTDGIGKHAVALVAGVPLFALVGKDLAGNPKNFTDLFVYNYDRPYPWNEVTNKMYALGRRELWVGDLLSILLLGLGAFVLIRAFAAPRVEVSGRPGLSLPLPARLKIVLGLSLTALGALFAVTVSTPDTVKVLTSAFLWLAFAPAVGYLAYEFVKEKSSRYLILTLLLLACLVELYFLKMAVGMASLVSQHRRAPFELDSVVQLLTTGVNVKVLMGFMFAAGGVVAGAVALFRNRLWTFGAMGAFAAVFALWFNWSHWVDLSHHWTQRDQFWRYYDQRKEGEPITAFLMNWRGETFYSRNTVKQIKDNGLLFQYANQPGREWALVEHNRLGILKSAVGPDKQISLVEKELNNKFVLVTIDGP